MTATSSVKKKKKKSNLDKQHDIMGEKTLRTTKWSKNKKNVAIHIFHTNHLDQARLYRDLKFVCRARHTLNTQSDRPFPERVTHEENIQSDCNH